MISRFHGERAAHCPAIAIDGALGRIIGDHADHLVTNDAQWRAVIAGDPRGCPPEAIPRSPFPMHRHLSTQGDNAMREFDPG